MTLFDPTFISSIFNNLSQILELRANVKNTNMTTTSVQDRTPEFRAVLAQAQKRQAATKVGAQRQSLLTDAQKRAANGDVSQKKGARSEFARRAAEAGRGITSTMEKLDRLAQCMVLRRSRDFC